MSEEAKQCGGAPKGREAMSAQLDIQDTFKIGENDFGYSFAIGRLGDRWVGFALGDLGEGEQGCFFLPGVSEGYMMGLLDRERAIKLTGAIAQASEHGYGGIARWFVPPEQRGNPDDFRCERCEQVGCSGECVDHDYGDFAL